MNTLRCSEGDVPREGVDIPFALLPQALCFAGFHPAGSEFVYDTPVKGGKVLPSSLSRASVLLSRRKRGGGNPWVLDGWSEVQVKVWDLRAVFEVGSNSVDLSP